MPKALIAVAGLEDADRHLRTFVKHLTDFTPFWRELAKHMADEAQSRWPLRRRTGTLRRSLVWHGGRLAKSGVYEASPDRLRFGTGVFYGRFHQHGAKYTPRRPLIHIDVSDASSRFSAWARARAADAGLEVDQ